MLRPVDPSMETSPVELSWRPKLLDLSQVPGAFAFQESFRRPDWKIIGQTIEKTISPENRGEAWTEAAIQWVLQTRADVAGDYQVRRSDEFLLLSSLKAAEADEILIFAERTLKRIYDSLREAAWRSGYGKHVILLFADDDDYYQYISFFYSEGNHPVTAGCLINRGYVHVVMSLRDGRGIRQCLAHELVHNSVVHLPLPLWLNEGLAVLFDRTAVEWQRPILDAELRDRHLDFWNPVNIQKFWSGVSFGEPGDSNELSYSLAEIIVNLMLSEHKNFGAFVKEAQWGDAGQTAASDCLGVDLGQVMGTFLGEGNWQPNRKAMDESWKAVKAEGEAQVEDQFGN